MDLMIENFTVINDETYQNDEILSIADLRYFLVRVFYPCLLIWGTIGNALCLRVLLSKKFFKNSTCQYLAILAVIDILFIFMRSSKHITKLFRAKSIYNISQWICRILTFSSSALAHMASWILVIVSFDRYLIVTSRYRRQSSAANRVLCSTSILIAIVVLCNLYYFYILGLKLPSHQFRSADQQYQLLNESQNLDNNLSENSTFPHTVQRKLDFIFVCIPRDGFERFFGTYIPIFDILLVAVIPFFLLCFTNIGIIVYTMRTNRRIRQHRKHSHRRHQRLTIMLLSVTLAFIGLTCPSVIFICVNKIIYSIKKSNEKKSDSLNSAKGLSEPPNAQWLIDVCEALWYTKHAMNFILYTLSGQDFRREFVKLFTQCCLNRPSISKQLTNTTRTISLQTIDSASIEVPMITKSNRKRSKKQTNNGDITSSVSANIKKTTFNIESM
ncbi:hypothetical protein I4U23_020915 [Adineta vaga]|nr:hypothetical protein I4U23_020915 [Adineta vaga]